MDEPFLHLLGDLESVRERLIKWRREILGAPPEDFIRLFHGLARLEVTVREINQVLVSRAQVMARREQETARRLRRRTFKRIK